MTNKSNEILNKRQIKLIVFALMAGMFLSALDQTIVSTSIRTIADDLNGLSAQAWVTTAYLIASTVSTPIYGKMSDIFGRRRLLIISILVFVLGSLLAGTAQDMAQLAIYRAVQGLGAGGLMALPLAIMGDILSPRDRPKYQGYFLAVFGVSSVIGPLIGGLFAGAETILGITGWRWVFLINVPIGIVAFIIVYKIMRYPYSKRDVRIDWGGAALVILAIVPLLILAEQGREFGWTSITAIILYISSIVGIVGFILVEKRAGDAALIPLKLFKNSTFRMSVIVGLFVGFAMFGGMLLIPLLMQIVAGATPTQAGLRMVPMVVGMMLSTILVGQTISRTGKYKIFPVSGTICLILSFAILLQFNPDRTWPLTLGMITLGLGLGQLMQTLTVAAQNAVTIENMGVATSSATFFRQIGGTIGTAVIFSTLFSRLETTIADAFKNKEIQQDVAVALKDPEVINNPANEAILEVYKTGFDNPAAVTEKLNGDTSFLIGADPRLAEPFLVGFSDAAHAVFYIGLGVSIVAFILTLFLKPVPLRQHSGLQEQAEANKKDEEKNLDEPPISS